MSAPHVASSITLSHIETSKVRTQQFGSYQV